MIHPDEDQCEPCIWKPFGVIFAIVIVGLLALNTVLFVMNCIKIYSEQHP
jgi:hypothetical protein